MAGSFSVSILTPHRKVFDGTAESLVAPAALGYVGILANHAPYMTTLTDGKITIRDSSGKISEFQTRSSGFMEVLQNKVVLLLGSVEARV